jgi:threonine dehydratase
LSFNSMITHEEVEAAVVPVGKFARETELRELPWFTAQSGVAVLGKLEMQQAGGSYKVRGASYALSTRSAQERTRGVITFSTGNFGRAVAIVARQLAMPCTVYLSPLVPENKLQALRETGARIEIFGSCQDEAEIEAQRVARESGAIFLSPLTDLDVCRGHGTIAVELRCQLRDLNIDTGTLVVPVSGGGLLAGILAYTRTHLPGLRVVGASMTRGAAMFASLLAGRAVQVAEQATLADSLGGGVGGADSPTVPIAEAWLDEACLVGEEEIYEAVRFAALQENLVCEGAAAVPLAAALNFARRKKWPEPVIALLTGQNIDPAVHQAIVADSGARTEYRTRDLEWQRSAPDAPDHWQRPIVSGGGTK